MLCLDCAVAKLKRRSEHDILKCFARVNGSTVGKGKENGRDTDRMDGGHVVENDVNTSNLFTRAVWLQLYDAFYQKMLGKILVRSSEE